MFLSLLLVSCALSWAGTSDTSDALSLAQNRLESTKNRKSAVERLKDTQDPKVIDGLLKIVKNQKEPVSLRAHTLEVLIQMDKMLVAPELKKIAEDSSLTAEIRKSSLHALWKQDPASMTSALTQWANNSDELPEIRVAAIGYLSHAQGDAPPSEFWNDLLSRKNPVSVRIACLNAMEQFGLLAGDTSILLELIRDAQEGTELRKSAVITASRMTSPTVLEEEFLSILANPKDSFAMKMFAIDNLSARPNPALLPRVANILQREKLPDLKKALEELATELKKPGTAK